MSTVRGCCTYSRDKITLTQTLQDRYSCRKTDGEIRLKVYCCLMHPLSTTKLTGFGGYHFQQSHCYLWTNHRGNGHEWSEYRWLGRISTETYLYSYWSIWEEVSERIKTLLLLLHRFCPLKHALNEGKRVKANRLSFLNASRLHHSSLRQMW